MLRGSKVQGSNVERIIVLKESNLAGIKSPGIKCCGDQKFRDKM
jgi:hypothetical protein